MEWMNKPCDSGCMVGALAAMFFLSILGFILAFGYILNLREWEAACSLGFSVHWECPEK